MSSNSKEGSQEELSAAKSETSKEEGGLDAYAVKISASQADGTLMNDVPEAPVSEASAAEKDEQLMSMPPPEPKQAARKQQMPTPQEQPDSSDSTIPGPADADRSATPELPDQQIVDFDWTDLETQYHNRIRELEQHEIEIMKEFDDLIKLFTIWASTSQTHEVDRSFKRLKTQTALVQHEEKELEKKRQHYISVVEAFQTVFDILNDCPETEHAATIDRSYDRYSQSTPVRMMTALQRQAAVESHPSNVNHANDGCERFAYHNTRCIML